ncbi:MAG: DUF6089 family protein [Vicingaceae bacterium]
MQRVLVLFLVILLLPVFSQAQKWKRQRVEYSFGIGATNFLGDLGGRDQEGSNFIQDFELKATRYAANLGYRYQLGKNFYVKGNLIYAKVSGTDKLTNEPARAARQLNFKSNLIELSAQLEYMLIRQKSGLLHKLRGVRGKQWFRFEVYALAGIGGLYYDPKGERDGEWHSLAPLNTEGQGLEGGPKDYSQYTMVVPYGIGIRRNISGGARSRNFGTWSISLELTMRKTFSDYIDDVSTSYYADGDKDPDKILQAGGEDALYFHDPSGLYNNGGFGEAQQRGDPSDNDAYMLGIISINYKPARRRRNLPKF